MFTVIQYKVTKELGHSGTAQFIRHFDMGSRNYTEERKELLKDVTLDDIIANIKKRKGQQK